MESIFTPKFGLTEGTHGPREYLAPENFARRQLYSIGR